MLLITTGIHAIVSRKIIKLTTGLLNSKKKFVIPKTYWIGLIVLAMFFASLVESFAWALAYLSLNVIDGIENAFYFSLVCYTTVGFGDIVLHDKYRLLSTIEAANGIIIFGWSTAIVMALLQRISFGPQAGKKN